MKKSLPLVVLAFFLSAGISHAAPTQGKGSSETVLDTGSVESKKEDEADKIITNRMLRASTGSLSKWSMNSSWSYSAGSIKSPFNAVRPNIRASASEVALQSLSGSVGLRYRINATNSLTASTGLSMMTPFHRSVDTNRDDLTDSQKERVRKTFDENGGVLRVSNPTLTYTRLYKVWGIQNITSFSNSLLTSGGYRSYGYRFNTSLSQQLMYEVPNTKLSFGLLLAGGRNFFDQSTAVNAKGETISLLSEQAAWELGAYPALEYVLNDTFNLRTIAGVFVYEYRRDGEWYRNTIYQSVGLGISVTRDVFLYPNVQFLPGNLTADATNLGVNANINLF